jgi:hypothetical protein
MTLDADEFIRRFLLHVLPDRFVKIRHYGILANRCRKEKIKRAKEILGTETIERGQRAGQPACYDSVRRT